MDTPNPYEAIRDAAEIFLPVADDNLIDEVSTTYGVSAEEVAEVAEEILPQGKEPISETKKGAFPRDKNEFARRKFAEWLATPKKQRQPATQQDFGLTYSIHPATLSGWKHDPLFHAEYVERVKRELRYRAVDALDTVADKAETGDLPSLAAMLEAAEWKSEKPSVVPVQNTLVNLSLQQVLASTEEPKELPGWQRKTLELEEVG